VRTGLVAKPRAESKQKMIEKAAFGVAAGAAGIW